MAVVALVVTYLKRQPDKSPRMEDAHILWTRLDRPGHEVARLRETTNGHGLEGAAVFAETSQPCDVRYTIACDRMWRTISLELKGWIGNREIALAVTVDDARRWVVNGHPAPDLHGCDDVDLGFSPSTNLLPIRRMSLEVGQRAAIRAGWVRFPACVVEPLDQLYERIARSTYRYESAGGRFTALLEVNDAGFVTSYPGFWEAVTG